MPFYVYIMTNSNNTVLYTGMSNNVPRRMFEHRNHVDRKSFTARYNVEKLVYAEQFGTAYEAIVAEKRVKKMLRADKIKLIESINPEWKDIELT